MSSAMKQQTEGCQSLWPAFVKQKGDAVFGIAVCVVVHHIGVRKLEVVEIHFVCLLEQRA